MQLDNLQNTTELDNIAIQKANSEQYSVESQNQQFSYPEFNSSLYSTEQEQRPTLKLKRKPLSADIKKRHLVNQLNPSTKFEQPRYDWIDTNAVHKEFVSIKRLLIETLDPDTCKSNDIFDLLSALAKGRSEEQLTYLQNVLEANDNLECGLQSVFNDASYTKNFLKSGRKVRNMLAVLNEQKSLPTCKRRSLLN